MKKYIVGYSFELDKLVGYKNKEIASHLAEDWLEIEAESLEKAKEKYEQNSKSGKTMKAPDLTDKQGEDIVELCKKNSFYVEWTSDTQIKALIQGMDFAKFDYNGISWNLNIIVNNNKKDQLKQIQNILNQ